MAAISLSNSDTLWCLYIPEKAPICNLIYFQFDMKEAVDLKHMHVKCCRNRTCTPLLPRAHSIAQNLQRDNLQQFS
jgi:hypothetical protein